MNGEHAGCAGVRNDAGRLAASPVRPILSEPRGHRAAVKGRLGRGLLRVSHTRLGRGHYLP